MLHGYKSALLFSSHSSLTTRHCLFNRPPRRLEITVTHINETPATPINRQLSGILCDANHISPITNNAPSNRQCQILEFPVSRTKQTPASRSNRHFLRCLDRSIQQSQDFYRTRPAPEGPPSTRDFQPSPFVSNRNNTPFKITGNALKINIARNPNRNTNRELRIAPRHPLITDQAFSPLAHSSTYRVDPPARVKYNENAATRAKQYRRGSRCLSRAADYGSRATTRQSRITTHKNVRNTHR